MWRSLAAYFAAILTVVFSLLMIYMKWALTYWKRENVPYLKPNLPFGNFKNPITNKISIGFYLKMFYEEFKSTGKKYGGVYTYFVPIFVTVSPEYNKHILVKDFQHFHARGFYNNEKYQPISLNLLTLDGDRWRTLRTKLTPTFTSAKMKTMFNSMVSCGNMLEKHVERHAIDGTPLNARDCVSRLTADIIGSCAFGLECNSFQDPTFYHTLKYLFEKATNFFKQSFCAALPKLANVLRIPLLPPKETGLILDSINEVIKFRAENEVSKNDFLQMLLEMKKQNVVDMKEIHAQCALFFIAGYETSATTLTFALFELAYNQNVQDKLRNEIHEVLSKDNYDLTYEAVQNMKYLEMVVNETLRKYPPIQSLKRKCVNDYRLPNSDVTLKKGTMIFIPILGFHYDPEFFPNPQKFDPNRFSEENFKKMVPYTYLPFGEGPRNCIGDRFGKLQVKIGLISLIKRYRFKLNARVELPLAYFSGLPTTQQDILLNVELIKE